MHFDPDIFIQKKATIIFIEFDKKGDIVAYNKYAEKMIGKNILAKNYKAVFIDFNNQISFDDLISSTAELQMSINTATGEPETFAFCFYQSNQNFIAIGQLNNNDYISLRKQMLELNNELNTLNRELFKQKAELEKLNKLKSQFMGAAVHDLRNPVGNMMSVSQLLTKRLKDSISEKNLKFLQSIYAQGKFSINLLNELLQYTKLETGSINISPEEMNIQDIIDETVFFQSISASEKDIKIIYHPKENEIRLKFDKNAIQQVLNNLISNAIKFSHPKTEILINVIEEKNKITIFVQDEGQGIKKEEIKDLFEPFRKTSTQPTNNESSTGLGLAIVRKIIEAHNGIVWATSIYGRGSTFYFTIPFSMQ